MTKLNLLTFGLLFTALAQANVVLETKFQKDSQELIMSQVTLTQESTTATYSVDNETFEVVLTETTMLDEQPVTRLEVYRVVNDTKELIMQPEFIGLPATLTVAETVDGVERSITLTLTEVQ